MGTEKDSYQDYYLAQPFLDGLRRGDFPMSILDDKVRRNLRVMIATQVLDGRRPGSLNTKAHQDTARHVAEEAMVLLKNNDGILPLDPARIRTLAVIGENATRLQAHGGQSSEIKAFYEVTPLEGIVREAGSRINITYSLGYGKNAGADAGDRAVAAAKAADAVIFVGGLNHDKNFDTEGSDRVDLKLPSGQDELIRRVVAANPRTVVVLVAGSPVEMGGWLAQVPAVLQAWYSGMEGGNALARVLFGEVNPSGKLPCTFPKALADSPAHALGAYPGKDGVVHYEEGLLVGYRWFDTKGIEPLFPFGHGLSYSRFEYSALQVVPDAAAKDSTVMVRFELTNAGTRAGAEVVQVYVHQAHPSLSRPEKELKGFKKVYLRPGEKQIVTVPLNRGAFSFYDPARGWIAETDEFTIQVGSSSRDIRLREAYRLTD